MFKAFGRTTVGYKKLRSGLPSEDAYKIVRLKRAVICAVADGHGDSKCKYADIGSATAVEVACEVLRAAYQSCPDDQTLYKFCANNRENFERQILGKWRERVFIDYLKRSNDINAALLQNEILDYIRSIYTENLPTVAQSSKEARERFALQHTIDETLNKITLLYGTTLNAVLNTESFVLCVGIGDGDIVCVQKQCVEWLLPPSDQFSIKTASLCWSTNRALDAFRSVIIQKDIGKKKRNKLFKTDFMPDFMLIATDGFRNSFVSDDRFVEKLLEISEEKTKDYLKFQNNSQTWIEQLSKDSLYQDDVTFVLLV